MKIKGIIATVTLSAVLGMGVVAGLATQEKPAEVKALSAGETVYLRLDEDDGNWSSANSYYAVYACEGSADSKSFTPMTEIDSTYHVWSATIPANNAKIIFTRHNPGEIANQFDGSLYNWDNRWNQSGDLMIANASSNFWLKNSGDDYSGGSWCANNYSETVNDSRIIYKDSSIGPSLVLDKTSNPYQYKISTPIAAGKSFKVVRDIHGVVYTYDYNSLEDNGAKTDGSVSSDDGYIKINNDKGNLYSIYVKFTQTGKNTYMAGATAQVAAEAWASRFLSDTGSICSYNGDSADHGAAIKAIWSNLSDDYNTLNSTAKGIVQAITNPIEDGNDLNQAVYRYGHIMHRYGEDQELSAFTDGPAYASAAIVPSKFENNSYDHTTVIIIIAAAAFALAATGCFFFMRKKEDR